MALLESIASEREYSCQKLCSEAGVTKGTVSHHVRELLRAGLIDERKEGHGMGLAIAFEILRLNHGTIEIGRSGLGGLAVKLQFVGKGRAPADSTTG